ncbi:calmodulin-like isoform X1 [Arachis ipaensis]|uniref:calmodulin-like isoform X1 n=1 Tax=Arachis ipaensis TaxID=130454 RepID=UPI0007AFE0F8|nr:calmodulin-like isoform X1 [Arachis ipaensis]XP_020970997.1 calmodulin-like isoform X1 [Arachis ipaensis]XP_025631969.1 calmodulin-like isoform X1 [Arachis hypogaea]
MTLVFSIGILSLLFFPKTTVDVFALVLEFGGNALTEDQVAEFREAFSFIDKDHDGFISVDELATIIKSLEGNPTKEEIQHMISEVDIDGSGSIGFEEFINIMATKMKENLAEELKEEFYLNFINNYLLLVKKDQQGHREASLTKTRLSIEWFKFSFYRASQQGKIIILHTS